MYVDKLHDYLILIGQAKFIPEKAKITHTNTI